MKPDEMAEVKEKEYQGIPDKNTVTLYISDINNSLKNKSGIYMITNKITKKIYIGKSKNLLNRLNSYLNEKLT